MSYKLTCPGCDTYTSANFQAYENGRPCPGCGASLSQASGQFYRQLPDDHSWPGGNPITNTVCGLQWTTGTGPEDPADTGVHVCAYPRAHGERLHLCRCGNRCGA